MNIPSPHITSDRVSRLDWINPLRALALLVIMLNHFVEEFARGPWFTNPSDNWPTFIERISDIYPTENPFPISLIQFLGWLGDSGPGVFILLSGFGLTWSAMCRSVDTIQPIPFYQKRLWRILPLYILCHFIILFLAVYIPGNTLTMASPKTLLSLMGLRFHDSLFFYINPSWWFIWLILQLYLVFPFLYHWLGRFGTSKFIVVTISLTVIVRLLGLQGIRYGDNLYFWMTGLFFGTRLAEFCTGMVVARLLYSQPDFFERIPLIKLTALSVAIYFVGLACSFTLPGAVVSNLLVTLGLCGIFYGVWRSCLRPNKFSAAVVAWIGINSFGIFLIHQTPLKWTAVLSEGLGKYFHICLAILFLLAAMPVGAGLSKAADFLVSRYRRGQKIPLRQSMIWVSMVIIAGLIITDPRKWDLSHQQLFHLFSGVGVLWLFALEMKILPDSRLIIRSITWTLLFALTLKTFVLYNFLFTLPLACGLVLSGIAILIFRFRRHRFLAWTGAGVAVVFLALALEVGFTYLHPLEVSRWGEYPALQIHPTRVYGLKPNQVTRLKYNNYDYILQTNSLGLPGEEVSIEMPEGIAHRILVIGDAFTMPEGMVYNQAYPFLLQKMLSDVTKPERIEVINAGVTGYGPVEQLPQLRELVPLLKPDIVVYQLFVNEFQEVQLEPEDRQANIGFKPDHRPRYRGFIENSQAIANLRRLQTNIKEVIEKKPASWRYPKSLIGFYEKENNPYFENENLLRLQSYLEQMVSVCQTGNAAFIIYFVPAAVAVSPPHEISYLPMDLNPQDATLYDLSKPFGYLRQISSQLSIPVVDLTPYLKNYSHQPVYFRESWHWNQDGHHAVAEAIRDDLIRRNLIQ
jgi:peptidoglycan/LPS O-acetylase OafA/YrhL